MKINPPNKEPGRLSLGRGLTLGRSVSLTLALAAGATGVVAEPPASQPRQDRSAAPRARTARAIAGDANATPAAHEKPAIVQSRNARRLRAIRESLLESSLPRLRERGRQQVLEIDDPRAIEPLARELSRGGAATRELLLDALQRFDDPAATLNIAVLALADPDEQIAGRARRELCLRADPSTVPHLRQALYVDADYIVGRAATALAALQATEVIPDLINVLTARKVKPVEVSVPATFGPLYLPPHGVSGLGAGNPHGAHLFGQPPILMGSSVVANLVPRWTLRDVTVMRTDVLEALKALSGRNYGFDVDAWARWYDSTDETATGVETLEGP